MGCDNEGRDCGGCGAFAASELSAELALKHTAQVVRRRYGGELSPRFVRNGAMHQAIAASLVLCGRHCTDHHVAKIKDRTSAISTNTRILKKKEIARYAVVETIERYERR